jgi:hypothetical protein
MPADFVSKRATANEHGGENVQEARVLRKSVRKENVSRNGRTSNDGAVDFDDCIAGRRLRGARALNRAVIGTRTAKGASREAPRENVDW